MNENIFSNCKILIYIYQKCVNKNLRVLQRTINKNKAEYGENGKGVWSESITRFPMIPCETRKISAYIKTTDKSDSFLY